jgi:hypothetical protein
MYLNGEDAVSVDGVIFNEEDAHIPDNGNGGITRLWRKNGTEVHENV